MPRRPRVFVEGATYHVYARITRREEIFVEPENAGAWISAVHDVKQRDGFAVLAWCLMSNHFHLLLQTGAVPLWRSMRSIQGRFAVGFNRRRHLVGPVWQSRYKAKVVGDDAYLRRVIAYIHLNPVSAGIVVKPEEYRLSGHREILGTATARLADPDEVLRLFAETRRAALRAYRGTIGAVLEQVRQRQGMRPNVGPLDLEPVEDRTLGEARVEGSDALAAGGPPTRPLLDARDFVARAGAAFRVSPAVLRGRTQDSGITRLREAIALVGTERYGLRLKAVAAAMGKGAETASRWVVRASARRQTDAGFGELLSRLDASIADLRYPNG